MTERPGGSDVGNSETIAVKNKDGTYSISGYKFFTSASTSEATFMLARVVDEKGNSIKVHIAREKFSNVLFREAVGCPLSL